MKRFKMLLLSALFLTACGKGSGIGGHEYTLASYPLSGTEESGARTKTGDSGVADSGIAGFGASDSETGDSEIHDSEIADSEEMPLTLEAADSQKDLTEAPSVSFEVLRDGRLDSSGEELIFVEYPKFSVSQEGYEALSGALDSINREWQEKSTQFLNDMEESARAYRESADGDSVFSQKVNVTVTRCDADIVGMAVSRTVEEGGPHPNNYFNAYNLDAKTGKALELSDVMAVDEGLKETIREQLYENYPELEFDDELVKQEVSAALENNGVEWYFWEGQIVISFVEGSFGFSHAEGSLGVAIEQ